MFIGKEWIRLCFLLFVLASCREGTQTIEMQAEVLPVEDFFRNPENSSFVLSPSGKQIAFAKPYQNRMNLFVTTLGSGDTSQLTFIKDRNISSFFWKGDERIVYSRDLNGDENFHLFSVDIGSGKTIELTPFEGVNSILVDELKNDAKEILIGLNKENKSLFDVYKLNCQNGRIELVQKNPGAVSQWICDHKGELRLAIQSDGVNQNYLYRENASQEFKRVLTTSFKESLQPLIFTFDNKYVYASSNIGRDKAAIVIYDMKQAKELAVLFEHPMVDVSQFSYSEKHKKITSLYVNTAKNEQVFLDTNTAHMYLDIQKKLGTDAEIYLLNHDVNEDKFIVRTISDRNLGATYLYQVKNRSILKISERAPWLQNRQLCERMPIAFKASDGLLIHGYLTLPYGKSASNLPVVVNPHGGPWDRDYWGWNPEVQFLANRGYAVLQINFRGSTGYGRAFWEAGFKQWGRAMQQDITDGVNWLIKEGIANPKKIGIYGASYGGYATLAGLTFTPDLYACGVDYVGVSNMFTFMKTVPPYWKPFMNMMYEMVGDPIKDSVMLREVSPVFHVHKIKAPLFIAQGANDPRVNKSESDQMVEALKKRGVKVLYMVKENEGHGFSNEENRLEFYREMERFLAKHLGGRMLISDR
ncbi:MAG: S9 family peptidase [Bacteroidia bacterium]|nr:S9 family peptidase [Bacteroidia bacterium]